MNVVPELAEDASRLFCRIHTVFAFMKQAVQTQLLCFIRHQK